MYTLYVLSFLLIIIIKILVIKTISNNMFNCSYLKYNLKVTSSMWLTWQWKNVLNEFINHFGIRSLKYCIFFVKNINDDNTSDRRSDPRKIKIIHNDKNIIHSCMINYILAFLRIIKWLLHWNRLNHLFFLYT